MSEKIIENTKLKKIETNSKIDMFTNQAIDKINFALEKFRYNVIIAVFHEIYSFFKKISDENKNYENLENNFKKILIIMTPVIPHLTNECLNKIQHQDEIKWPKVNFEHLKSNEKNIVIQINGKKRNTILVNGEIDEKNLIEKIKNSKNVEKYIDGKQIIKTIYIKNKLINIIIK